MNRTQTLTQLSNVPGAMRNLTCLAALAFLAGHAASAPAQPPSNADNVLVAALETVVISGSRSEQRREDLPLSVDVITAAELEEGQLVDIRDLAKGLPNFSVKRAPARFGVTGAGNPTGRDGNAGFNVRGLDGNRVLMLIDGIRLPRSYINGSNAFGRDTLSLELLKRIELVRGPSSVLYGSDALAGLVNFITLEPSDFLKASDGSSKPMGGKLSMRYAGDDQSAALAASLAYQQSDTLQWLLTGSSAHANALDNMGVNDSASVDRTRPNPQSDKAGSVLGKFVLQPQAGQKHVLTFEHVKKDSQIELLSSRTKAPFVAASVMDESATKTMQRQRLAWNANYSLDAAMADYFQTTAAVQSTTAQDNGRTLRKDMGLRIRDTSYNERAWQLGVQADKLLRINSNWVQKITYGLDLSSTDVSSFFDGSDPAPLPTYLPKKYFPDTRDSTTASFLQSEFASEQWRITPGLRWEQFDLKVLRQSGFSPPSAILGKSLSGVNVSPKLGALHTLSRQWSLFANYASGFRAPNAAQVNGFTENPTPSTFVSLLPNPDLKPETSRNLELGVRARLDSLSFDAAVFAGHFHQLIVDKKPLGGAGLAGDPLLFQTVNIDNASIDGFEIKGLMDLGSVAQGTLTMPFSYGRANGRNNSTGRPLSAIDPSKLTVGLKYKTVQWDVQLGAIRHAAKTAEELESPYLPKPINPPRIAQLTLPAATTLDLQGQWRVRKDVRVNWELANLSNRRYWLWSDVQGLAANSAVVDAYSQPGRHASISVVMDY
ncbi:MAG: TonB-dependent hemoglobin/transferrin/lactoferrin family receptor [Betaproteobacteria bacterium]|jgi:hemoglobin/transferrin/lactoferrin receptor protein|nr:TonB-dependent hemoglobin/transferrin/lactoferrin family receptor [Betaproteobacteria bacterium]